jgi:hypothetical protein
MKKLIFIFLAALTFSCKQPKPEDPFKPTGTIVAVTKLDNSTYILVEFRGEVLSEDRGSIVYQYWIYGSDTCKVGQIVNLK